MFKLFLMIIALFTSVEVLAQTTIQQTQPASKYATIDRELLSDLLNWASLLSGLPKPINNIIKVYPMSENEIAAIRCPEEPLACRGLVALYDTDTYSLFYRNTLDMRDFSDQSFIVHELVHYLQYNKLGDKLFETCEATVRAETQAYSVQNEYLKHYRQWMRVGEMIRFMNCNNDNKTEPTVSFGGPGH